MLRKLSYFFLLSLILQISFVVCEEDEAAVDPPEEAKPDPGAEAKPAEEAHDETKPVVDKPAEEGGELEKPAAEVKPAEGGGGASVRNSLAI